MVIDVEIEKVKEYYEKCRGIILIYGIKEIIRKELRDTPKNTKIWGRKLRSNLLGLYDVFAGKHELPITDEHENLANEYYKKYRAFGGSKSKAAIFTDFLIVACASAKGMDVVVSEDEKTMLTENAKRAYEFVNKLEGKGVPNFVGYKDFKAALRSRLSDKLIGSPDEFRVLLVFLNFLHQLIEINVFLVHSDANKQVPYINLLESFAFQSSEMQSISVVSKIPPGFLSTVRIPTYSDFRKRYIK